jgi:hypothetical protein
MWAQGDCAKTTKAKEEAPKQIIRNEVNQSDQTPPIRPHHSFFWSDQMKFILAIVGINAANKAGKDETGQLAVLSLAGLLLFVFVAALVTNLILKRRKEKRAKLNPEL